MVKKSTKLQIRETIKTLERLHKEVDERANLHGRVTEVLLDYYMLLYIRAWKEPDPALIEDGYPQLEDDFERLIERLNM